MHIGSERHFLFLQGPHGPFFYRLATALRKTNARVCRVGFNAGDRVFWRKNADYIKFDKPIDEWRDTLSEIVIDQNVTDIVLYGDTREIHASAIEVARKHNLEIHVFEEGYMRPYWVTYERNGSNGHSRLMDIPIDQMQVTLSKVTDHHINPPAHWGDMRQHVFYGAAYHWFVLFRNQKYPNFRPHRELSLRKETLLYTRRLLLMPYIAINRAIASRRIRRGGYTYHLALMQLEHDASFQAHSPFTEMEQFVEKVMEGFANGAPADHHLVFKAHPLENGRAPMENIIETLATKYGLNPRVHYLQGGKLAPLLDQARSAVTINSTAAQQALWRGLPVKVFGKAVYAKPELVSDQSIEDFFQNPTSPDPKAYRDYRRYLLETSQIPGGYYASRSRKQLLKQIVQMMLSEQDPYDALAMRNSTPK